MPQELAISDAKLMQNTQSRRGMVYLVYVNAPTNGNFGCMRVFKKFITTTFSSFNLYSQLTSRPILGCFEVDCHV